MINVELVHFACSPGLDILFLFLKSWVRHTCALWVFYRITLLSSYFTSLRSGHAANMTLFMTSQIRYDIGITCYVWSKRAVLLHVVKFLQNSDYWPHPSGFDSEVHSKWIPVLRPMTSFHTTVYTFFQNGLVKFSLAHNPCSFVSSEQQNKVNIKKNAHLFLQHLHNRHGLIKNIADYIIKLTYDILKYSCLKSILDICSSRSLWSSFSLSILLVMFSFKAPKVGLVEHEVSSRSVTLAITAKLASTRGIMAPLKRGSRRYCIFLPFAMKSCYNLSGFFSCIWDAHFLFNLDPIFKWTACCYLKMDWPFRTPMIFD